MKEGVGNTSNFGISVRLPTPPFSYDFKQMVKTPTPLVHIQSTEFVAQSAPGPIHYKKTDVTKQF